MKIGFATDHRGYQLKTKLKEKLTTLGYEIKDYGTYSTESVDYPDFAFNLGKAVVEKDVDFGVAICGSGIGISIACNKVKGIRCAKVCDSKEAQITRIDNNSNIVAFGENVPLETALDIIEKFVNTEFSKEEKHHRRVNKIINYEENNNEW